MASRTFAVVAPALLAGSLLVTACGDPLVVLGDAPGLMRVVLGTADTLGTRVDTVGTRNQLLEPTAIAFNEGTSVLYVADRGATTSSGVNTTRVARMFSVSSRGRSRLIMDAGGCSQTCILHATAMTLDTDGALLVADALGHRMLRVVPGGAISVLAGTGVLGSSPDGAVAATAPLSSPSGVAIGDDGSIYFSESSRNRVRRITPAGTLETVAGNGAAAHSGDGGPATAAAVSGPAGLLWLEGVLYIAEAGAGSIRAVRGGTISTVAGVGANGYAGDGGPATSAQMNQPVSIAPSLSGRILYVADRENDRVRAVDLDLGTITTFAGTGGRAWTGSRRAAGETSLYNPVAVDAAGGFLFVVDRGHHVVWRSATDFN